MKPLIILLTSQKYRDAPYKDDLLLKQRLENLNCHAEIVAWDDAGYPFENADLAVVRSCWDYHLRAEEYLQKIRQIAAKVRLLNSADEIEKYASKHYLNELAAAGINTVQTVFCKTVDQVLAAVDALGAERLVLKPAISASGENTHLLRRDDKQAITQAANSVFALQDELLLQPFINSVQTRGERSSVVIAGEVLFTMCKTPAKGGFLVHEHHGGQYIQTEISQSEQDFLTQIGKQFPTPPLYMRVDYLQGDDGQPLLLELELNEPNLYLARSPILLDKLSRKIIALVRDG